MSEHVPPDEDVPDGWCGREEAHEDHYWRLDGKRFRYLDDPTARYCDGSGAEPVS